VRAIRKSSPLKIALIRKRFNLFGGAEAFLGLMMARLVQLGHEVHLFSENWENPEHDPSIIPHRVPSMPGPAFVQILCFAVSVRALLRQEKFDIVHSFERTLKQDVYRAGDGLHAEWIARRLHKKNWIEKILFFCNPFHLSMLFLERKLMMPTNTGLIICNSRRGAEEIVRRYRFPRERIRVIYNGISRQVFQVQDKKKVRGRVRKQCGCPDRDFVALFMGSGYRRKGVAALMQSLPFVQDGLGKRGFRLLIVGRERRLGWYKDLAVRLGVDDVVSFIGPTVHTRDFYLASDLFVLPTIYEPFSNACLEAFACGLPVITTEVNGFSELIRNGENGWVLKEGEGPKQLAELICHFSDDRLRKEASLRARTDSEEFTIERAVDEMVEVYRESIAARSGEGIKS